MRKLIELLFILLLLCGCSKNTISTEEKDHGAFICQSADGKDVYDRVDSHFHEEGGLTWAMMKEAISHISIVSDEKKAYSYSFDETIGKVTCVEVDPEIDDIVYVYRLNRDGMTPMVKNKEPQDCDTLIVVIGQKNGYYTVATAYIGKIAPREPWDKDLINNPQLKKESEDFWSCHALVYDENLIDFERTDPSIKEK